MPLVISYSNANNFDGYYFGDQIGFQAQMGERYVSYYNTGNFSNPESELGFTLRQFSQYAEDQIYTDETDYWQIELNDGDDSWCWLTCKILDPIRDMWVNFTPRLVVNGGNGDDTIGGGSSDDTVSGGAGSDVYLESFGNDLYYVSDADDSIIVSDSNIHDWYGGAVAGGNDTVSSSVDFVLPSFIEHLILSGAADLNGHGNETSNTITGNSGSNILDGGLGVDTLFGGLGDDVYVIDSTADQVVEKFGEGLDIIETGVSYTLSAFVEQGFLASAGRNQSLTGNTLGNLLVGNSGMNTLSGLAGKDELRGEGGTDSLYGGIGIDTLDGGSGADHMVGGANNDIYYVDNGLDVVIELIDGGYDTVFTSTAIALPDNMEKLVFNGLADGTMLAGNDLANFLVGNYTDDIIDVGAGSDSAAGGSGDDTLLGGSGNDTLLGEFGIDSIVGGLGRDILIGGVGADLFVFVAVTDSEGANRDLIKGFEDGLDRIDLRQIDANALPGDQAFTLIGNAVFSAAGQVRVTTTALATRIEVSIDADPDAEMLILLNGVHSLTDANFIL